jgi:hypothetical protein
MPFNSHRSVSGQHNSRRVACSNVTIITHSWIVTIWPSVRGSNTVSFCHTCTGILVYWYDHLKIWPLWFDQRPDHWGCLVLVTDKWPDHRAATGWSIRWSFWPFNIFVLLYKSTSSSTRPSGAPLLQVLVPVDRRYWLLYQLCKSTLDYSVEGWKSFFVFDLCDAAMAAWPWLMAWVQQTRV